MFEIKQNWYVVDNWVNSLQRKSKCPNSLKPALSLGKLSILEVQTLKMLGKFFDSSLLLVHSVIMKSFNEPNKSSFKSWSNAIITGYKLSLVA